MLATPRAGGPAHTGLFVPPQTRVGAGHYAGGMPACPSPDSIDAAGAPRRLPCEPARPGRGRPGGPPVPTPDVRRSRPVLASLAVGLAVGFTACGSVPQALPLPDPAPRVWIFGEEHDQPDQQRQIAATVQALAQQGRLAAVVLEMANRGQDTRGLAPDAPEAAVRERLAWQTQGWPWEAYGPVVMAAVRAGVPVIGGNLPRAEMRAAMADASLEERVDAPARERLLEAVKVGHCGLLPANRERDMLRGQIGRDAALARTLQEALPQAGSGQVVVLHTGVQHASRDRGVPVHLARDGLDPGAVHVTAFGGSARGSGLQVDSDRPARRTERPDPCIGLAEMLNKPRAASAP